MSKVNIKLPKALLDFDPKQREEVIEILREALKLPKTKTLPRHTGNEHNLWEANGDTLLAEAEDELYRLLATSEAVNLARLMDEMGLPILDDSEVRKSFSKEFLEWEESELAKAGDKRPKISELINRSRKQRKQFIEWVNDKRALPLQYIKKVEERLKENLPDYAKVAEAFAVRAGFIGKIRNQAERENFETLGALIDRYPETLEASNKEGVVLTTRQKAKAEAKGKKVKVLPLTLLEKEAVTHATLSAGDKLTEVSEKHRTAIRQMVIQAKKERWTSEELARALYDKFGEHNRDWRRVAITELSFAVNDAYLSGLEEGERVIGMGSVNACKHCKTYVIGKELIVTHELPKKDTFQTDMKMVWVGKTNYGRRVAEYRACIPMHPNCRCRWHRVSRFYQVENDGTLKRKTTAELIQEERAKRGLPPDPNIEAQLENIQKLIN